MNIPVLGEIVRKIQDPRYLFILALLLIVGSRSVFNINQSFAWVVVALGFFLVLVMTVFDFISSLRKKVGMSVALKFPSDVDASTVRLVGCEYVIVDPRNSNDRKTGTRVRPCPAGGGWVCPVPEEAQPTDLIDFIFIDEAGGRWLAGPFAPDSNWPTVDVRKT